MDSVRNAYVRLAADGQEGWGEHAPSPRVTGEGLDAVRTELVELRDNQEWVERLLEDLEHLPSGVPRPGARNAFVSAWLDLEGRRTGQPANKLLNLPPGRHASSVTVTIDEPEKAVANAVRYAEQGWHCFKVKLGSEHDERVVRSLRDQFPTTPIRVDANEGWSRQQADHMLGVLQKLEVEFVEQPLPRHDWEGLNSINHAFEIPIFLDESVLDVDGLLRAVREDAGDGVVVKLTKCGGLFEARRMVKIARDHGWKIMVGCNIESSAGMAAGSCLSGVVDYLDLDGAWLISNDPFSADIVQEHRVGTPTQPGLGLTRRSEGAELEPLAN